MVNSEGPENRKQKQKTQWVSLVVYQNKDIGNEGKGGGSGTYARKPIASDRSYNKQTKGTKGKEFGREFTIYFFRRIIKSLNKSWANGGRRGSEVSRTSEARYVSETVEQGHRILFSLAICSYSGTPLVFLSVMAGH